eukprot:TRINITY_DN4170_c0_g1_i10.p1 TRINITY_DN4170_c0_g1~~TRINITY_DN4170_c0_g1_i10.p1  ORF type:complete len:157 (+),score=34.02 TRINITY_DN4170_c0_g1_i10:46-471(+)
MLLSSRPRRADKADVPFLPLQAVQVQNEGITQTFDDMTKRVDELHKAGNLKLDQLWKRGGLLGEINRALNRGDQLWDKKFVKQISPLLKEASKDYKEKQNQLQRSLMKLSLNHKGSVFHVCFSPDGAKLATACDDNICQGL